MEKQNNISEQANHHYLIKGINKEGNIAKIQGVFNTNEEGAEEIRAKLNTYNIFNGDEITYYLETVDNFSFDEINQLMDILIDA